MIGSKGFEMESEKKKKLVGLFFSFMPWITTWQTKRVTACLFSTLDSYLINNLLGG